MARFNYNITFQGFVPLWFDEPVDLTSPWNLDERFPPKVLPSAGAGAFGERRVLQGGQGGQAALGGQRL